MNDLARVKAAPGEWPSPISAEVVAENSGVLGWPSCVGEQTWWTASDPRSSEVHLICHLPGQQPTQILPLGWSVRNQVNGYGGRPYVVVTAQRASTLIFTEYSDGRLYKALVNVSDAVITPIALTPPDGASETVQYADPILSHDGLEIWCIRESSRRALGPADEDPATRTKRDIVAIPLNASAANDSSAIRVVAQSHHFLSGVRISPDGRRLAWIGWDHPAMPWDQSELVVADLTAGIATAARPVLGGIDVAVPQAEWDGPDNLYAMADPAGWWNLHSIELATGTPVTKCVLPLPRDCADALWRVGSTWFAVTPAGVVLHYGCGSQHLAIWSPTDSTLQELAPGWDEFGSAIGATSPDDPVQAVAVVAGSGNKAHCILRVPLSGPVGIPISLATDDHEALTPWTPEAERRIAHRPDGTDVHYVYYRPTNPNFCALDNVLPPLLIDVHGGPTGRTGATPDLEFSLFCSRGFAVASVDYGGSTGYGREYRNRLRRNWGIVDVEDCATVARAIVAEGLADSARIAIRGGSAGGWTALACLASTNVFCAGAVYYPISDPLTWSSGHTHDFESRYLESLVGELPADLDHYRAVSPAANAGKITSPLVMLQGADDFICKPDQAQLIIDAVSKIGLWHRYLIFAGEGHGFRKKTSVQAALELEAELYSTTMGITVNLLPVTT